MSFYDIAFLVTLPLHSISVYLMLSSFLGTPKIKSWIQLIIYSAYGGILAILFVLESAPIVYLIYNLVSLFLLSFLYNSTLIKKISFVFIIYSILLVIETVVSLMIFNIRFNVFIEFEFNSIIGIIIVRIVNLIASYYIYRYYLTKSNRYTLPNYYYIFHSLILIGIIYLYISSMDNQTLSYLQIATSSVIMFITIIMIIVVDKKIYDSLMVYAERNILREQMLAFEKQKEVIEKSVRTTKNLRHDMKNHIISLNSMYKNKEYDKANIYSNEIISQMESKNDISNSNNFIIDSLINFKLGDLKSEDIQVNISVDIPEKISITPYDITIILGNLLDNAITAVKKCIDKKEINISIYFAKGNLILIIENTYNNELLKKGKFFLTTKKDTHKHGMGLQNIEDTIQKYNGIINISHTENFFSVTLIIPM